MMEILTGASNVRIGSRANFSNVGRDQYNNCTVIQPTRDNNRKIGRDILELSEFTEIKRGNIYNKVVCYSWRLCSKWKDDTQEAVYYAQLNITTSCEEKWFTVKQYRGRNAMKEWKRDFLQCSDSGLWDAPLFGYNKSMVPLLIFYGELVPVAHIEGGLGWIGLCYLHLLSQSLGCSTNQIWMDPTQGRFCCGPIGPECITLRDEDFTSTVPSDVEFLKEDVVIQYLSSKQNNWDFLRVLVYSYYFEGLKDEPNHIQIISSSTNSTIAFTQELQWWSWESCLDDRSVTLDGATSFHFIDGQDKIEVYTCSQRSSWLSQALSVFHTHNISFNENLSDYKLVGPLIEVKGTLKKSKHKQQRRQLCPPIYFIVLPSPYLLYHWSFDPTGKTPVSPDMCKYLGLPFKLSFNTVYYQYSWPTRTYKLLHDYQIRRGFDPKTMDFAQSLGADIFDIVPPKNHFQEIVEEQEIHAQLEDVPLQTVSDIQEQGLDSECEDQCSKESEHSFFLQLLFDEIQPEGSTSMHEVQIDVNSVSTQKVGTKCSLMSALFNPFSQRFRYFSYSKLDDNL